MTLTQWTRRPSQGVLKRSSIRSSKLKVAELLPPGLGTRRRRAKKKRRKKRRRKRRRKRRNRRLTLKAARRKRKVARQGSLKAVSRSSKAHLALVSRPRREILFP